MKTYAFDAAFARQDEMEVSGSFGLTKHEYFAAMALTGLIAHHNSLGRTAKDIALDAVELADALIAALNGESTLDNNMDA